jgi:hypothetical protein
MASPQLLEGIGGIPGVKLKRAGGTNLPFTFGSTVTGGGVTSGAAAQVLTPATTIALVPASTVIQDTPAQGQTINFATTGYATGAEIWLEFITSGVTSYTITFGTGTKNQGTLATGTVTAKTFIVNFVFDGTNWVETSRTAAM